MSKKRKAVLGQEQIDTNNLDKNQTNIFDGLESIKEVDPTNKYLPSSGNPIFVGDVGVGESRFDSNIGVGDLADIEDFRASQQTEAEQTAKGLGRVLNTALFETAKIPGYVAGLGAWATEGFNLDSIGSAIDNSYLKALDKAKEAVNEEALTVYVPKSVREGGLWNNITSSSFWATEGADAVGTMLSFLVPGGALKAIKLGIRIARFLGKGAKFANYTDDIAATITNTLIESSAEAGEVFKENLELTGDRLKAGEAAVGTLKSNMGLLLFSNALEQRMLFGGFNSKSLGNAKRGMGRLVDNEGKILSQASPLTWRTKGTELGKKIAKGIASEGFYEEGLQFNVSDYFSDVAQGKTDKDFVEGIVSSYIENIGETDFQKSVLLGSVIGSVMGGIDASRRMKAEEKLIEGTEEVTESELSRLQKFIGKKPKAKQEGLRDVLNRNFVQRYYTLKDLAKVDVDEAGNEYVIMDNETNQIVPDPNKVAELGEDKVQEMLNIRLNETALAHNNKELFEFTRNVSLFNYLQPYLENEGGKEVFNKHIEQLAEKEASYLKDELGLEKVESVERIKEDLFNKFDKFKRIYDRVQDKQLITTLKSDTDSRSYLSGFLKNLKSKRLSNDITEQHVLDRIEDLQLNIDEYFNSIDRSSTKAVKSMTQLRRGETIEYKGNTYFVTKRSKDKADLIDKNGNKETISKTELNNNDIIKLNTRTLSSEKAEVANNIAQLNEYNTTLNDINRGRQELYKQSSLQKAFNSYVKSNKDLEQRTKDIAEKNLKNSETTEDTQKIKNDANRMGVSDESFDKSVQEKQQKISASNTSKEVKTKNGEDPTTKHFIEKYKDIPNEDLSTRKNQLLAIRRDPDTQADNLTEIGYEINAIDHILNRRNNLLGNMLSQKDPDPANTIPEGGLFDDVNNNDAATENAVSNEELPNEEPAQQTDSVVNSLNENQATVEQYSPYNTTRFTRIGLKTSVTNLAYLANEYSVNTETGLPSTKLDEDGNIVENKNHDRRVSIASYMNEGEVLIVRATGDLSDVDNGEIAIQTEEDYQQGIEPKFFVHRMDWVNENNVAPEYVEQVKKETKAIREQIATSNQPLKTKVLSKSTGFTNYSANRTSIVESIKSGAVIGIGDKTGNLHNSSEIEGLIDPKKGYIEGVPYLVIPTANGNKVPIYLRQFPLSNKGESFSKFTDITASILSEASMASGTLFSDKSEADIIDAIRKYFYVTNWHKEEFAYRNSTLGDALADRINRNLLFNVHAEEHGIVVELAGNNQFYQEYIFNNGNILKRVGKNKHQSITINKFISDLRNKLSAREVINSGKYANVYKKYLDNPSTFSEYELENGILVENPRNYYEFLDEHEIVNSNIQIINVEHEGHTVPTFTSQPNIGISASLEPIMKTEEKPRTNDVNLPNETETPTKLQEGSSNISVSQSIFDEVDDVDDVEDITDLESDLIDPKTYNKLGISSFRRLSSLNAENEIINSLLNSTLNIIDEYDGKLQNINEYLDLLKSSLSEKEALLRRFSEENPTDMAKALGVKANKKVNKKIANNISFILDNFEKVESNNKVQFVGFRTKIAMAYSNLKFKVNDRFSEMEEEGLNVKEQYDITNFQVDPEKSLTAQIKRLLTFIPQRTVEGKLQSNALGMTKYRDYIDVFKTLSTELSDLSMEEIVAKLEDLSVTNPMINDVNNLLKNLKNNSPDTYNKFLSVFKKQSASFKTILYMPPSKKGGAPSVKVIDSNSNGAARVYVNKMHESFKQKASQIGLLSTKGANWNINNEKGKQLLKDFDSIVKSKKITTDQKIKKLTKLFNSIGIDIHSQTLTSIENDRSYAWGNKNRKYKGSFAKDFGKIYETFTDMMQNEFRFIFSSLAGNTSDITTESYEQANPFYNQSKLLYQLARHHVRFSPETFSASFRNAEGNMIYSYVAPHHKSNTYYELLNNSKLVQQLNKDVFSQNSYFIRKLSNSEFIKNFGLFYFDASKNTRSFKNAKTFERMNDFEKELTSISLLLNQGKSQGYSFGATPSDKSTFSLTGFGKIDISSLGENVFNNGSINKDNIDPNSEPIQEIFNIVHGEIKRINKVVREFNTKPPRELLEGYHYNIVNGKKVLGAGAFLHTIPAMNDVINRNSDGSVDITSDSMALYKGGVVNLLSTFIQDKVDTWQNLGIIDEEFSPIHIDKTYIKNKRKQVGTNLVNRNIVNYAAADFVINNAISLGNEFQLVTGDPALAGKADKNWDGDFSNWDAIVNNTASNLFKRIAKDIAPGTEGNFENKNYKVLYIKEPKLGSPLAKYSEQIGKHLNNYKSDLDAADAQEWTTAEEHIETLYAFGRIPKNIRDSVLNKLENNEILSTSELRTVLTPLKPVQVMQKYDNNLNMMVHYYIKTSSFPLIPQVIQGTPLEEVYNMMKANGINRLVPPSAVKIGQRNSIEMFDDTGNISDNLPETIENVDSPSSPVQVLPRSGFRIQQDVPYDISKNKILEGSQYKKLRFADLLKNWKFNHKGKSYNSQELRKLDESIHIEFYNRRFNQLLNNLGVDPVDASIRDVDNLRETLVEEAINRGYGENEIILLNSIELEKGKVVFNVPLFYHPSSNKIESLLNSLIKNKVLKNKFQGKSYVQGSSVGLQYTTYEDFQELSELGGEKPGIAFTKDYDGSGLKYDVTKDEEGNIKEVFAEVFIPFDYFDQKGNRINLSTIVDENGYIDESKIDENLLNMIGYRIPTQGHNSIIKLKVKGFIPQIHGDLIIVPPEITKQMGSDFDVDKLYTHRYNASINDSKLSKIEYKAETSLSELTDEQLENQLLDITFSIYNNPNVVPLTTLPLDNDKLAKVKEDIVKLRENNTTEETTKNTIPSTTSLLYNELHKHMIKVNADGKVGIGAFSLASVFHTIFQYNGTYIRNVFQDVNGTYTDENAIIKFTDNNGNVFNDSTQEGNSIVENTYSNRTSTPGAYRLDKVTTFDSNRNISEVISSLQSAAVDNAKEQLLYDLNLNGLTFDVASLIARTGFDERYIGNFLSQPVIRQFVNRLYEEDNIVNSEYSSDKENKVAEELYKTLGVDTKQLKDWSVTGVNLNEMQEAISNNGRNNLFQAQILFNFIKYKELARQVSKYQSMLNVDTKYLGKSIYDSVKQYNDIIEGRGIKYIGNSESLFSEDTIQGAAISYGLKNSLEIFTKPQLIPINSPVIVNLMKEVAIQTGRSNFINEDIAYSIINDVKNVVYTEFAKNILKDKLNIDEIDVNSYRNYLLYGNSETKSLAERVQNYEGDNKFIKSLVTNISYTNEDPSTVEGLSSGDISGNISVELSAAWDQALQSSSTSEESSLSEDLVIYSMLMGTERTARDFFRYIPADYLFRNNFGRFAEQVNLGMDNMDLDNISGEISNNFIKQWFQHNPYRAKKVIEDHIEVKYNNKRKPDKNGNYAFKLKEGIEELLIEDSEGDVIYPQYLTLVEGKTPYLYEKFVQENKVFYKRISTLGNSSRFIKEYNISNSEVSTSLRGEDGIKRTYKEGSIVKSSYSPETSSNNTGDKITTSKYGMHTRNKSIQTTLERVVRYSPSETNKKLAEYFLSKSEILSNFVLDFYNRNNPDHGKQTDPLGRTKVINGVMTVLINEDKVLNDLHFEHTILHEATHAFTKRAIHNYYNNPELITERQKTAITALINLHKQLKNNKNFVKELFDTKYQDYQLSNVEDFISFTMSNQEFQDLLNKTKLEGSTVLDKIIKLIRSILGISASPNSALAIALNNSIRLIDSVENLSDVTTKQVTISKPEGINVFRNMMAQVRQEPKKKADLEAQQFMNNLIKTAKDQGSDLIDINNMSKYLEVLPKDMKKVVGQLYRNNRLKTKCN